MIKILDLFSGTQSVRKALDLHNVEYEYYGIDIYSPEEDNIILDLSQDDIVDKVVATLPDNWKPDFIWASPVCSKFSRLSTGKGGNFYYEFTKFGIKPRTNWDINIQPNYMGRVKGAYDEAVLHIILVENMLKILKYYDSDYIIENPYTSLIERLLPVLVIKNKVDYCRYGFNYKKPTAIYSNKMLDFKTCNHKTHKVKIQTNDSFMSYELRASVPPQLIIDIFKRFDII